MFLSTKQVEEARQELLADCQSIEKVAGAEGRELTPEECKTVDTKMTKFHSMEADLDRAKKYEDAKRQSMLKNARAPAIHTTSNDDNVVLPARSNSQIFSAKVWGSQAAANKAATQVGHYLRAIVGNQESQRFVEDNFGQSMQYMGQRTDVDADGGYLVPEIVSATLLEALDQYGIAGGLVRRFPMAGENTKHVNIHKGGIQVYSPGEASQITESDTEFSRVTLNARDYYAMTFLTARLRSTAVTDVADYVMREMGRAFAKQIDTQFLLGDGTSNSPNFSVRGLISVAGALQVEAGGTTWSDFDAADFTSAVAALPSKYWSDGGPSWIMSRAFYHSQIEPMLEAAGGNTKSDLASASPRTLKGIPIVFSDLMPAATAVDQVSAILVNARYSHIFGDIQGVKIATSDQHRFDYDELTIRGKVSYAMTQVDEFDDSIVLLKTAAS